MKLNLLLTALTAAALLPTPAGAAPPAQARQHHSTTAKSSRRPAPTRHIKPRGRAFILNGSVLGSDPNRLDHMAIGWKTHPERMDPMNAAPPVRAAPVTPK